MVDIVEILRLIDERLAEMPGETDASVSRRATDSPDTIRNWRRRMKDGAKGGVSTRTLQAVGEELDVDLTFGEIKGKIRGTTAILATLRRMEGLTDGDVTAFLQMITKAIKANSGSQAQSDTGDQSEPDNLRRESSPSPPQS